MLRALVPLAALLLAVRAAAHAGHLRLSLHHSARSDGDCALVYANGTKRDYSGCTEEGVPSSSLRVFYDLSSDKSVVHTTLRAKLSEGYASLAWGYNQMVASGGSYAVIAYASAPDADPAVATYHMTGKSSSDVALKSIPAISDLSVSRDGDFLIAHFSRAVNGSDVPDLDLSSTSFIWATSGVASNAPKLQHHDRRGTKADLDLEATGASSGGTGSTTVFSRAIRAHAWMMATVWLVVVPIAILAMHIFRGSPIAFQVHRALNSTGTILTVIFAAVALSQGSHLHRFHMLIGVAVSALAVVQVALGIFRPGKGAGAHKNWKRAHGILGGVAMGLAYYNVFSGLYIINWGWYPLLGAVLFLVVDLAIGLLYHFKICTVPSPNNDREAPAPSCSSARNPSNVNLSDGI